MAALMAVAATQAFAPRPTPPLAETRLPVERMHLNSIVRSQAGLVAGGELGHLLLSTDGGQTWSKAKVSKERYALINQIYFAPGGLEGMAVGHEGWILRTRDGGRSWDEVAFEEKNGEPLMSIARLPSGTWLAVGAFGRALRSDDGTRWERLELPASVQDKHMNRLASTADGRQWLIVGERGLVLYSADAGATWNQIPPFYKGSFYNALALPGGGWLVYGMRGNIYRATDPAGPWTQVEMPVKAAFLGHALTPEGHVLLVGQGSLVAKSTDAGAHFSITKAQGRASLTDLALLPDGKGWFVSDAGLQPYPPQADGASKTSSSRTAP